MLQNVYFVAANCFLMLGDVNPRFTYPHSQCQTSRLPPGPTTRNHNATNTCTCHLMELCKTAFEIHFKGQNVDSWLTRLILLKYPLVLKKNESTRGQEKGQYENGLLFLPEDLAPFRPNLSPNRPSTSFQSIYHPVSFTNSPPSCPELWAFSRISILPRALSPPGISQHLYASELVLFKHASQALIVLTPLVHGWSLWSHLFNGGGSTGRIFTCEEHQMACLKLNWTFFYKLLPLLTSLICQFTFSATQTQNFSYFWSLTPLYLKFNKVTQGSAIWPVGQIWATACFWMAQELRMGSSFLNGWKKIKIIVYKAS